MIHILALLVSVLSAIDPVSSVPAPLSAPQATTAILPEPKLLNVGEIVGSDDYPPEAIQANQQGTVRIGLDVDPAGSVSACRIVQSSGVPLLDRRTCELFQTRARFDPARDASGKAVAGTWEQPVRWALADWKFPLTDLISRVIIIVGKTGKTTDCTFQMTFLGGEYSNPCLADEQMKTIRPKFRRIDSFRGRTLVIETHVLVDDRPLPSLGEGKGEEMIARLSAELAIGPDGLPVDCWMIEDSTDGEIGIGCDDFRAHNFGVPKDQPISPPKIRHLLVMYTRA